MDNAPCGAPPALRPAAHRPTAPPRPPAVVIPAAPVTAVLGAVLLGAVAAGRPPSRPLRSRAPPPGRSPRPPRAPAHRIPPAHGHVRRTASKAHGAASSRPGHRRFAGNGMDYPAFHSKEEL